MPAASSHFRRNSFGDGHNFHNFVLTAGLGATKLVSGPDGIGGENIDEETFWWVFPEGWIGAKRMARSLWSSIGDAF